MTPFVCIFAVVCIQSALIAWIIYRFTPPEFYVVDDDDGDDPQSPQPDPDEEWKRNLDR